MTNTNKTEIVLTDRLIYPLDRDDHEEIVVAQEVTTDIDEPCQPGPNDGIEDEIKRFGNNKAHRSKTKRRAIAAMVKKSKRRNRK
jgi:hypothetical protein